MKKLLTLVLLVSSLSLYAQSEAESETNNAKATAPDDGVTNIILVPNEFEHMDVLEELLETMRTHEAFLDMRRSQIVMTPSGPSTEYKEIVEIRFKSLALTSEWRQKMESTIPPERRALLGGTKVLFYPYKQ